MTDPSGSAVPAEARSLLALCQHLALADGAEALSTLLLDALRREAGVHRAVLMWRDGEAWRPQAAIDTPGPALPPLLPPDADARMHAATVPAPDGGQGVAALPLAPSPGGPVQGWLWFTPSAAAGAAAFAVLPVFAALCERARRPAAGDGGVVEALRQELRGPMNSILGMSQLALRSGLTPQQHLYVTRVERAAAGLLGLVDDLLDQALLQAGALLPQAAPFDLAELMDQVVQAIAPAADEKGLELLLALPPLPDGLLVGDAGRLAQVLGRLGRRAVETTDRGEIALAVEVLPAGTQALRLVFTLRDTGLGLTREQHDMLARPAGAGAPGPGGAGLALAHALVAWLGGTLEAEARPAGGAQLRVTLPFALQPAAPAPAPAALRPARVLVVDDHPAAREQLQHALRTLGLHAEGAGDGWDALRAVALARDAGAPFELVFVDWKMPGMDGAACAAQLAAADPPAPRVALMALDGRDDLVTRLAAQRTAVGAVLRKPMTPAALRTACATLLGATAPVAAPAAGEGLLGLHGARLRGARILVVDDNAIHLELAQELLSSAGLAVTVANDGREALRLLAAQAFDGVLMDVQMPVLDGYAATRAIREQPRLRDLPVIAMTTSASRGDRERALAAGMNDHVTKPLVVEQLFGAITRWVRPASTPAPAAAPSAAPATDRLARLPGIDVRIGRASTMNNDALYRRLLLMFLKGQREFGRQFRAARAGGDAPGAMRMAHNLRTVSGSLGAPAVQAAARVLEDACSRGAGDAEVQPLLEAVERELTPVMDGLAALADETPANV